MSTNNDNEQGNNEPIKKKISLEEAIKQKLADKKQSKNADKNSYAAANVNKLKSQQTKKPNNQRRRTGV